MCYTNYPSIIMKKLPIFSNRLLQKVLFVVIVLIAIIGLLVAGYLYSSLQPAKINDQQLVKFVIPKGQSVAEVTSRLQAAGLIKNAWIARYYYQFFSDKYNLQAGSFELAASMKPQQIFEILSDGADDVWITFPEGLRREEIAEGLGEYQLPNYDSDQFLLQTAGMEGRLFPDTYLVPKEISTQALITLMNNTFEKKFATLESRASQSRFSPEELVVIASLLEREARGLEQMRQVAGVLYRRLEIGMPLQVDASLQYAKGYDQISGSWWSAPLAADKQLDSKYNTYLNPGLPPAPICNPGLEALTAAVDPSFSDNLYYIHDLTGQIHFARTLQEHNQNVNTYLQ